MATFKATVIKGRQRSDKTWTVFIRFTHERKVRYISTSFCATKNDLTASLKIKNQQLLDKCNEVIKAYRQKLDSLYIDINPIEIDEIVTILTSINILDERLDFVGYCNEWMKRHKSLKGLKNYRTALNSLCLFYGRTVIYCNEITTKKMKEFEMFLEGKDRAVSLYPTLIHRMFNDALFEYNDEENDIIRIKNTLARYSAPKHNIASKRAVDVDVIRAIYKLPYDGKGSRRDLAKDCFILSFCLMGINSVDLYNLRIKKDNCIIYNRQKTKDRREDGARMEVRIHPIIEPILAKYRDSERFLNFHKRYSNYMSFNKAINIGLKYIQEELGITDLDYYSARHSMATIARNKVGIDKYTVNDMLCHTDSSMKVTDLYIEKDYTPMNEANFKLIKYVFENICSTTCFLHG